MKTYEEIISQCENYKSLLSNCCYHIERNQFQDSIPLLVNIYNDVKPHESRLKDELENYVWAGNDYPHDARALLDIVEYYKQNETIISHWENVHNKDNRPKQEEPQQNPLTESLFIEKVKNGQLKGNDIYKYFETYEPRAAKNLLEEMEIIALAHFSDINGVHERLNKACEIIKEVFPEVKQSSLYPEDEQESGGQKKDKQSSNSTPKQSKKKAGRHKASCNIYDYVSPRVTNKEKFVEHLKTLTQGIEPKRACLYIIAARNIDYLQQDTPYKVINSTFGISHSTYAMYKSYGYKFEDDDFRKAEEAVRQY